MSIFDDDDERKRLKRYINILYTNAPTSNDLVTALEKYKGSNPAEKDFCDALIAAVKAKETSGDADYNAKLNNVPLQQDSLQKLHAHMLFQESSLLTQKKLEGYSSDEWAQLMNGADTAFNASLQLQEGIAVTALKEVLGDDFPQNFTELALDEQEAIINGMNAAQIAKFNTKVLEKAETLAEQLPPHQLVLMAKNVNTSLSEANLDAAVKQSLEQQSSILQKAMIKLVNEFESGMLETNPENVSGVYDGAMEMLTYLESSLSKNDLTSIKPRITEFKKALEASIKIYDESQRLQNVNPDNIKNIDTAYDALKKDVDAILSSNNVSTAFTQSLDNDLKDIFDKITFPQIEGKIINLFQQMRLKSFLYRWL